MLASSGLATPPCGVPRVFPLPPLMRRVPSASRSSIGALSHILGHRTVQPHYPSGGYPSTSFRKVSVIPVYKKGVQICDLVRSSRLRTDELCHLPPRADLIP